MFAIPIIIIIITVSLSIANPWVCRAERIEHFYTPPPAAAWV